jgi:hypothetical protein
MAVNGVISHAVRPGDLHDDSGRHRTAIDRMRKSWGQDDPTAGCGGGCSR